MSGGKFNYVDSRLKDEIFGWADEPRIVFEDREISELVLDVLNLIHDYDRYASGDTCKETYLKSKAEFKKKWMGNRGVRGADETVVEHQLKSYALDDIFYLKMEHHCVRGGVQCVSMGFSVDEALTIKKQLEEFLEQNAKIRA